MRSMILLGTALILGACAGKPSMTQNQCLAGDWESIGMRDGSLGMTSSRIILHQEACGEFGVVPNRNAYLTGYQDGLVSYCTADKGFQLGASGKALNTVCQKDLREPFASAHADGREVFLARREVNRLAQTLSGHERRIVKIKEELASVTAAQLQPELTAEERLKLLARLQALTEERTQLKDEIPELEHALRIAEDQLAAIEQTLAAR